MRTSASSILFITIFIDLLGYGIVIPLLPEYARTFGASAFVVGVVVASYSAMQFLFSPILGGLSDRCICQAKSGSSSLSVKAGHAQTCDTFRFLCVGEVPFSVLEALLRADDVPRAFQEVTISSDRVTVERTTPLDSSVCPDCGVCADRVHRR